MSDTLISKELTLNLLIDNYNVREEEYKNHNNGSFAEEDVQFYDGARQAAFDAYSVVRGIEGTQAQKDIKNLDRKNTDVIREICNQFSEWRATRADYINGERLDFLEENVLYCVKAFFAKERQERYFNGKTD